MSRSKKKSAPCDSLLPDLVISVDRGAFTAAVGGGKTLGADVELLDSFERQLHHGAPDGVVFVVDTVHGDVDIAAGGSTHGKYRHAVFVGS